MINRWWDGDPAEKYWMEITDRSDLGANLIAPTTAKGGKETFSYSLVNHVREGDTVFHWWKRTEPVAIVARSTVIGAPTLSTITWAARGSYSAGARTTEAFEAPLDHLVELDQVWTLEDLRAREDELRAARDALAASVNGPTYFPWTFLTDQPLRTTQGYLVKMPASVVDLLGLDDAEPPVTPRDGAPQPRSRTSRGGGRQQDPALRKATERYAVNRAMAYFASKGFGVEDVGESRSYDVLAVALDGHEIHVEVKGSITRAVAIELTSGEVKHWGPGYERSLYVVDEISWSLVEGQYVLEGGRDRVWRNWEIRGDEDRLEPTRYRYTLLDN